MANDIIKTLIAEALAEGPEGMRRVAETILNRSAIRNLTPEQVVRQPAQYTGLRSPGPAARKAWSDPSAIAAAEAAWTAALGPEDPTNGADHYFAPGTISKPRWANKMAPKGNYGGHEFFSSRPVPPDALRQVEAGPGASVSRSFRYTDPDSGNLLLREPTPTPAMRAGLVSFLNRPDDFKPARLPDLPVSTLDRRPPLQSIVERAPTLQPAPRGLLEALGSGSASARLAQGETPVARGLLASLTGNAGDSLARAPVMGSGASPLFDGAYSPSMDAITQIAPMASYGMNEVTPQRDVPQSIIERSAPSLASKAVAALQPKPTVIPQSIIERSPTPSSYPNSIRSIASMETTQRQPSSMDSPGSKTSWGDFAQAMAAPKQPTPIPLGNVMVSQAPRIDSIGSGSAWSDFTGTMAPRSIVAQPNAAPKGQEKLGGPQLAALAVSPQLEVQIPTRQQLDAAGFKIVTQDKRITNPAWTAYRAANPAQPTAIGSPVPLGEMTFGVSRDSKAAVLAGQNFAANKMPAQFITVKQQVRVPVVAQPAPVVRQDPVVVVPKVAPVPVSPFAPNAGQNPIMGLLNAITGQRGSNTLLSSILGAPAPGPAVGSFLGTAANGGQMIQGFNGVKNSMTQESDAWKRATGQSSYGSGQSNDTRYESYF